MSKNSITLYHGTNIVDSQQFFTRPSDQNSIFSGTFFTDDVSVAKYFSGDPGEDRVNYVIQGVVDLSRCRVVTSEEFCRGVDCHEAIASDPLHARELFFIDTASQGYQGMVIEQGDGSIDEVVCFENELFEPQKVSVLVDGVEGRWTPWLDLEMAKNVVERLKERRLEEESSLSIG